MKRFVIWLAVVSGLWLAGALAECLTPTEIPFEVIAWFGLILICAWAWVDGKKGVTDADRTRTVV